MNELRPRIGLFSACMIVMGSIIGSGIFKKVAPMTLKLQSEKWVLLCWLVAGIVTLFATLTYAEVASRTAQTGGLYSYLREMYGKWVSYLYGWSCFSIIQTASIASIAYVFAESVLGVFPNLSLVLSVKLIAIFSILLLSFINFLGVIFGALVENIFTVLKILGIILVIILGFHSSLPPEPVEVVKNSLPFTGGALVPALFSAMLGAFWAYDGFNNVGFLGGEVIQPRKNIPLALVLGVIAVLLIYLLVNLAYFHAFSVKEISTVANQKGLIFAVEMVKRIYGDGWAKIISLLLMASTFGATNSSILASSRIYYAMAKDKVFFSIFQRVHPRFGTPSVALLAQAIWASLLVLLGSFDELTDMLIFASFAFYGLGAFGLFRLRKTSQSTFTVPSWIPLSYGFFCFLLVVVNIWEAPKQALVGAILVFSGLPLVWLISRSYFASVAQESTGK